MFPKHKGIPRKKYKSSTPLASFSKLTIGLFLLGFVPGCIGVHFLQDYLYGTVIPLFRDTVRQLPWLSIDRNEVFLLSFRNHLTYFLLSLFFALTNVWRLYYIGSTVYTGFCQGLLFSFCTMTFGIAGVLQYLCFLLPHTLLLVPLFLYILHRLESFHRDWFFCDTPERSRTLPLLTPQKRQLIFHQLPFLFACIVLLLCCSILEGYLNVPIIKSYNLGLN